ncbi:hypothetical protein ACSBR1_000329 [Camellia fascicularis]
MESLSRPLHRNQASSATFSKKLSNVNSFSAKNAYDGVFDGASKFGAATSSTRTEDYSEIFGGSQASRASSIPILDLSALDEARVSADARTSNLDYSKIFGGLRGEDIAISYEEMFATPKGAKSFSDEARTPEKAASPSDGSDQLNRSGEENFQYAAPNQSSEGMKQFNMSYHKTIQRSDDETNGTTHVAQLRAVPAFTCFIDENHPHRKTEGDKSVPTTKVDVKSPPKVDVNLTKKQTSDDIGKFKTQSSWDKFNSINKSFSVNENSPKTHPSKKSSPSSLPKSEPKRSMDSKFKVPKSDASRAGPGDCSPSFSDEEVDVNSAAAASAAALRIALEKAQASIRIAKELMDRKKDGPQRFSKPSSKDGLDVKKRKEDKATIEENRTREKNGKEIFQSADVVLQVFTKSEREKARRSGKVAPDFKESEEIFIVKEVGGETNGNKLESAEDCEALRSGKVAPEFKESEEIFIVKEVGGETNGNKLESAEDCEALRSGKVAPDFKENKEIFNVKEVGGETNGNELESAKDCEALRQFSEVANQGKCRTETLMGEREDGINNIMPSVDTHKCGRKEMETEKEILEQLDGYGKKVDEEAPKLEDFEGKLNAVKMARDLEQPIYKLDTAQEIHEQEENEKARVAQGDEETEEKQKASSGQETYEKKLEESLEESENEEFFESEEGKANSDEEGLDDAEESLENEKKQEEVFQKEQNKLLKDVQDEEESVNMLQKISEQEEIEKRLQEACEWVDNEEGCEVESNEKGQNDAHKEEDNEKSLDINYNRVSDGPSGDESEEKQEDDSDWVGKEKILVEACEYEETENMKRETKGNATTELNPEAVLETMNLDATSDACKQDADESVSKSQEAHIHDKNDDDLNFEENERISDVTQSSCDYKEDENGFEAVEVAHELGEKEICKLGDLVEDAAEHIEIDTEMKYATEALLFDDNSEKIGLTAPNSGPKQTYQNEKEAELDSNLGSGINISECELGTGEKKFEEDKIASDLEEVESFDSADEERQWVEMEEKIEASQPHSVFKGEGKMIGMDEEIETSQNFEKNEENLNKTFAVEEKETKETAQEEVKAEKENLSKNDEANKREREREKDKRVVERAIREARERAFAEARERAERAAVERATAEARQRVVADARERFEKSSAAAKSSAEKASIKAKLRAERAAVERATAEARERALEKALSQKATTSGVREQAERYVSEKFSSDSRDNGMRQSFPSSDTQQLDGSIGESAQRSKARLERHQRTMERAAKALAEKNKRDLLAQKEQAEKNRLAETLDAEVKRWSSGKEGNLRALLSTLQYILGPDSGWQPISLTEIVTTSAVKKAYRKATLHVHPDKLQQRGASIQQKYICEKVFDLLKAAWNRFNFEER